MIVAFSGWKKSGKDTASDLLVNDFRFKKVSFATPLKDMVCNLYNIPRNYLDDQSLKEFPLSQYPANPQDKYSDMIIDFLQKEFKKDEKGVLCWTPRALAILEGSTKRSVSSSFWVQQALSQIEIDTLAVIADMRYKSEARQVREYANRIGVKSLIIRVNRFDTSPSVDPSERDMDDYNDFDSIVENKGTLEEFQEKIANLIFSNF